MKIFSIKSNAFKSLFLVILLCCTISNALAESTKGYFYARVTINTPTGAGKIYYSADVPQENVPGLARSSYYNKWETCKGDDLGYTMKPTQINDGYCLLFLNYKNKGDSQWSNKRPTSGDVLSFTVKSASGTRPLLSINDDVSGINRPEEYNFNAVFAEMKPLTDVSDFQNCVTGNQTKELQIEHMNAGTIIASVPAESGFKIVEGETIYSNVDTTANPQKEISTIKIQYNSKDIEEDLDVDLTLTSNATTWDGTSFVVTIPLSAKNCDPEFVWQDGDQNTIVKQGDVVSPIVTLTNNTVQIIKLSVSKEDSAFVDIDGTSITAKNLGSTEDKTITITAHVDAAGGYNEGSDTHTLIISNKTVTKIEVEEIPILYIGGTPNTANIVATVKKQTETDWEELTGATITYAWKDGVTPTNIVSLSGTTLTAETQTGSAILVASYDGNEDYIKASTEIQVLVLKANADCGNNETVLNESTEITLVSNLGYSLSGPSNALSFNLYMSDYTQGFVNVHLYKSEDDVSPVSTKQANPQNNKTYVKIDVPLTNEIRYIKFELKNLEGGSLTVKLKDVKCLRSTYLDVYPKALSVTPPIFAQEETSFVVDYSNQASLRVVCDDNDVEIIEPANGIIDADACGKDGKVTVKVKTKAFTESVDKYVDLKVTKNDGTTLLETVTLHIVVSLDTYYFLNATGDGKWGGNGNWSLKENEQETPTSLPTKINPVVIKAPAILSTTEEVYGMTMDGGSLTITSAGGLTVFNGGIVDADETNLRISSDAIGVGYLRAYPGTDAPSATVDLFVTAYTDYQKVASGETTLKAIEWQYLSPLVQTTPSVMDYYGWIYQRYYNTEKSAYNWKSLKTTDNLNPFTGYAMTQSLSENGAPFTYAGELSFDNYSFTPDKAGHYLFANGYPAPIDVAKLAGCLPNTEDATVYLFNKGSWNLWSKQKTPTTIGEDDLSSIASWDDLLEFVGEGQYMAVPVGIAGALKGMVNIAPMQGFMVYADGSTSFKLNYEDVIWGGTNMNVHTPLFAPARKKAAPQEEMNISEVIGLRVAGEQGADMLFLLEASNCSNDYDNGYDGKKIFGANANPQIYTTENDGKYMMISATNNLEDKYIGFQSSSSDTPEMTYTIEVIAAMEGEYILHDNVTGQEMKLATGNTYEFTAISGKYNDTRFQIKSTTNPGATTSLENYEAEAIRLWQHDQMLFGASTVNAEQTLRIYDMQGKIVANTKFTGTLTYDLSSLPQGAYMANVGNKSIKIVLK